MKIISKQRVGINLAHGNRSRAVALPRRDIAAEVQRKYDALAELIVDRRVRLDTVLFWLPRFLKTEHFQVLNKHCSEIWVAPRDRDKPRLRGMREWYYIQQPEPAAFQYLADLCEPYYGDCIISRVDVSLDLITADTSAAMRLQAFLDAHLIQRWHGQRLPCNYRGTAYSDASKGAANAFTVYSDRPSKGSSDPCCHLEWRMKRPGAVASAGLRDFSDLFGIDRRWHRDFWEKRLRLEAFDIEALGMLARGAQLYHKSALGQRSGNFIRNIDRDRGGWLAKAAEYQVLGELCARHAKRTGRPCNLDDVEIPAGSALAIKDGLRMMAEEASTTPPWTDYRKALVQVPNDAFLPVLEDYV